MYIFIHKIDNFNSSIFSAFFNLNPWKIDYNHQLESDKINECNLELNKIELEKSNFLSLIFISNA